MKKGEHPRPKGVDNGKWRGGVYTSDKGYRRISRGEGRGWYEHRWVVARMLKSKLCAEYVFPDDNIPPNLTVEHLDHNRTHNCPGNLMLLEKAIHDACSRASWKYMREHYAELVEANTVPDWVNDDVDCGHDELERVVE